MFILPYWLLWLWRHCVHSFNYLCLNAGTFPPKPVFDHVNNDGTTITLSWNYTGTGSKDVVSGERCACVNWNRNNVISQCFTMLICRYWLFVATFPFYMYNLHLIKQWSRSGLVSILELHSLLFTFTAWPWTRFPVPKRKLSSKQDDQPQPCQPVWPWAVWDVLFQGQGHESLRWTVEWPGNPRDRGRWDIILFCGNMLYEVLYSHIKILA